MSSFLIINKLNIIKNNKKLIIDSFRLVKNNIKNVRIYVNKNMFNIIIQ